MTEICWTHINCFCLTNGLPMDHTFLLLTACGLLAFVWVVRTACLRCSRLKLPPGPPGEFWAGNARQMTRNPNTLLTLPEFIREQPTEEEIRERIQKERDAEAERIKELEELSEQLDKEIEMEIRGKSPPHTDYFVMT